MENRRVLSMLGDYLRDASVLILVFFPLDLSKGGSISITLLLLIAVLSLVLLGMGIFFEKLGGTNG